MFDIMNVDQFEVKTGEAQYYDPALYFRDQDKDRAKPIYEVDKDGKKAYIESNPVLLEQSAPFKGVFEKIKGVIQEESQEEESDENKSVDFTERK